MQICKLRIADGNQQLYSNLNSSTRTPNQNSNQVMKRYGLKIILLVNFFAEIYAPDEEIPTESFGELQLNQALPLVVFLDFMTGEFEPPNSLAEVFLDHGRIINGSRFNPVNPGEQIFFCPEENSAENCLVRTEFQDVEPLQCGQVPKTVVRAEPDELGLGLNKCGYQNAGITYSVAYNPDDFLQKEIPVYVFCYDPNNKKILFVNHGIIFPQLLFSNVLHPERIIKHRMEKMEEYLPANFQELEAAIIKEELNVPWVKMKNGYKAQKLVPPEDMPFALWVKPTYQYFNVELQHENLIDRWNEMNAYIRNDANNKLIRYCLIAGVFDLDTKPRNDDQLSNVWVKMIFQASETPWEGPSQAMVILMDNFIESWADLPSTSSDHGENDTDEYCEKNLCINDLKVKFQKVGGRVRCCALTIKIRQLFGMDMEDTVLNMPVLNIPGINDVIVTD